MNIPTDFYDNSLPQLHVSLDGFEGPLDLLLSLAKSHKVDLKKLQLGVLADQFLSFLKEKKHEVKLDSAGDYLVMASWLTLLKSKLIIPDDEQIDDETEKMNDLIAIRLQRLASIREKVDQLFDRAQLSREFFPSNVNRNEEMLKEDILSVQFVEIIKAYLGVVDKKKYEVSLDAKENYLFLDKAISFIEEQLIGAHGSLNFPGLVKKLHFLSGVTAKRCAASLFCGLLECTKIGTLEIKQKSMFSNLELTEVNKENTN